MFNLKKQSTKKAGRFLSSITTWLLLVAILIQTISISCLAAVETINDLYEDSIGASSNGIKTLTSDYAELNKQLIQYINKDLLQKVDEYELTGEVGVILSFSESSVISAFKESASNKMTYEEYLKTSAAANLEAQFADNQNKVLAELMELGLISEVKYQYCHILDGAFVTTTYEQLADIMDVEGVARVTVSDTYLPAEAVENPVNVYDTGIFNSSDISYTGKGSIVAILDTGCDYTHSAFTSYEVIDPLYDRDDIDEMLKNTVAYSYDTSLEAREVYYGNLTKNKIAFGYDYADKDSDIMPFSSEHGTHVAGIIGGKDDTITGVAIDTQLAIMKVFSDVDGGAKDGDILAALEDSIILGVDAINMSLGQSCGFSREVDDEYINDLYDNIEAAGISLIVAASNDYSSGYGSEEGNTNKTSNPDSATVGSPSTYESALSVASINGNKDHYMLANGDLEVFFHESLNNNTDEYDFFALLGITADNPVKTFEYVTIPGIGLSINYTGLDVEGKIALVKRGENTFEEKVQFAYEAGAIAVIVYNNVFGDIVMTIGNDAKIPAVSIGKDDGEILAAQETGTITFDYNNQAGPFMSTFSSWGPTPNLSLKPEITAHGGNILSAIPGGGYDKLSGTSMAAPNMCGIVVLIRQYVKEKYPDLPTTEVRDLVNQLCMSTATIALDQKGNPYSPRKQGAGIADILKATTTPAYLFVEGIGKTKLELGDDPSRTGVYTMSVQLKNLSDSAVSYRLGNITMTESVSTSDPDYVAEMGYLLSNLAEYSVENGTLTDGVVTVEAGGCATVTVTLTLSAADKAYLNSNFANGMYVEGFLTFDNIDENGVDLNAPFLAFYGDWSEAPIFDLDYYLIETEAHNNAIDDDDKIKPDYYATTPLGSYYYDYILPLGCYVYKMNEDEYTPIPATQDKAAVSYYKDAVSGIFGVYSGLLRSAKELSITIVDVATGETVWTDTQYNCYKSHYYGVPIPYIARMEIPMVNVESSEVFGYNNSKFEVTMTAKLDWEGSRNSSDTYTFSFYVDYEAPTVTDATFRTEYDKSREENRYYVDIMVYDNHYAMAIQPILVYDMIDDDGEQKKTFSSLAEYPIPIYQENLGETTKVTMEITDYIDIIKDSNMPEGITVYLNDYAMNSSVCYIPFPEVESTDLEFKTDTYDMNIHETKNLAEYLVRDGEEIESDYLKTLTWTSSDESVVAVNGGQIEALKSGTATITVTGSEWYYTTKVGGKTVETPITKSIVINVGTESVDNPNSADRVQLEDISFTSYKTLFAFRSDIDYSKIGRTDSTNYFGGNCSIEFYPSEKIQLFYNLQPWNISPDRYTLSWSSSNPKVASVDENGVVTAEAEGKARITLQITIDGKTSILAARCSVEVKSEFIIENRTLVAYKGKGGDVVIPDDEGIMTIGEYAFGHYYLDNKIELEKDENGYYDIDLKKTPYGNDTITSVVIPEGVETIEKYAFYHSSKLSSVTLPKSCTTIGEYAFYECEMLENVNFDHVQTVSNYAFYNCESLTGSIYGGLNLSHISALGDYAFAGCRMSEIAVTNLSRTGVGAFANCSKLEKVTLGERTRISANMFENSAVKSITAYSDIISDYAFRNCNQLKEVVLCNDLTYLGVEAFAGCSKLENITFEATCEEIATKAFSNCSSLETFTLPNCEVVFGDNVFVSSSLKKLIFGKNTVIQTAGVGILEGETKATFDVSDSSYYTVSDGILYSDGGTRLVMVLPGTKLGNFTVPSNVKEICDGAFTANSYLTQLSFASDSQLESIGYAAFAKCSNLVSVILPDHEITIGGLAFSNASKLSSINLEKVTSIGNYAFNETALTEVTLSSENVTIGEGAFYYCTKLKDATIGASASIGEYAFSRSGLVSVKLLGKVASMAKAAFAQCTKLAEFDFDMLSGKISDYAFYQCLALTTVDIPSVTEIGEGAFADCQNLRNFSAENLEVVGAKAFAAVSEDAVRGAILSNLNLPKLRSIGEQAFLMCTGLKEIDLSSVTEIGASAFRLCTSLESVVLSENLTELPDTVFDGCSSLSSINLENVVRFGTAVLYNAKLPAHLELTKAEYIGTQAFIESDGAHRIHSVNAPNLKQVGSYAFYNCQELTTFNAPKLEEIEEGAFAYTAIEEFEISGTLNKLEYAAFEGAENFKTFYATVDGTKVYDCEFDSVMLNDGVLYMITDRGYVLSVYPCAKEDKELTVADGTVRIELAAAISAKNLEKVILPESLRYIGNMAFYQCDSLKTVVFNSYYAPKLEGTFTSADVEITPDNASDYPGFDKLYAYDYYFKFEDIVAHYFYYLTFVDAVASEKASDLTYVIPDSCEGYDSIIYLAYFNPSDETSGVTVGKYAVAFIDAAKRLPDVADRFDKALIDAAINAYNALESHTDELAMVDNDLIARFFAARTEYNVSVVENKINHLFDMDNSEYSFNIVKDARQAYLSLNEDEKAIVSNAAILTEKIEQLTAAMGKEIDFNLTYAEHFPTGSTVNPPDTNDPDPNDDKDGIELWMILVIVGVAIVVIGVGCIVIILFKKKKKPSAGNDTVSGTEKVIEESPDESQVQTENDSETEKKKEADE